MGLGSDGAEQVRHGLWVLPTQYKTQPVHEGESCACPPAPWESPEPTDLQIKHTITVLSRHLPQGPGRAHLEPT